MQSVVSSHTISLSTWVYKETMVAVWSIVLSFDKFIQYSKMHDKKVGIRLGVGGVKASIIQGSKSPTWTPKIKRRAASVWFIGCPFQASRTRWSSSAVSLPTGKTASESWQGKTRRCTWSLFKRARKTLLYEDWIDLNEPMKQLNYDSRDKI